MSQKLAIIGAGGHARVLADAAMLMRRWESLVFIDDAPTQSEVLGYPVIGGTDMLSDGLDSAEYDIALGVGDNETRGHLFALAQQAGFGLPVIAHPSAVVSRFARLGAGSVVFAQGVVNAGARLGRGVIVNTAASVDHDCLIGDFSHISPGARLAGNTRVGDYGWVGIGGVTRQGSHIGIRSIIGAGAVVIEDIPDNVTAVGVPARYLHADSA